MSPETPKGATPTRFALVTATTLITLLALIAVVVLI